MRYCPVCERELAEGLVCDDCGFDLSRDYERNRTLCSALPKRAEPVSALAAKWKQQQAQTAAAARGTLVCPKCGEKRFLILLNEQRFMCADCETKLSFAILKETVEPQPVLPQKPQGGPAEPRPVLRKKKPQDKPTGSLIGLGRTKEEKEKADRAFDILMDKERETVGPQPVLPQKPQGESAEPRPVLRKKPQSESAESLIGLGRTKEEKEKADKAFDILMGKQ